MVPERRRPHAPTNYWLNPVTDSVWSINYVKSERANGTPLFQTGDIGELKRGTPAAAPGSSALHGRRDQRKRRHRRLERPDAAERAGESLGRAQHQIQHRDERRLPNEQDDNERGGRIGRSHLG